MTKKKRNTLIFLVLILGIAAVLRFVWADRIPHSVNEDQLHYLLSAKTLFFTGKDFTQTATLLDIFTFKYPEGEFVQAELPYLLLMTSVGMFPFTLLGNALPNILLGILIVGVMYLLAKEIFKSKTVGLVSAFLTAVSPWLISMSRTSYEMVPATLFYLLAFYLLIKMKGQKLLWAIPVLLLAFYSYIATKLIFLPLVVLFIVYGYFIAQKKKDIKQYGIVGLFSIILVGFFAFQLLQTPDASRTSEIMTPFSGEIADQVNQLRRESIKSPLQTLFINKFTIFSKVLVTNIFNILSPTYLFMNGDYFFSLYKAGPLYPLDAIFIIAGFAYMYMKKKKLFWFFISAGFITIIPHIIHDQRADTNFTPHITLFIPLLILAASYGMRQTYQLLKRKKVRYFGALIAIVYLFGVGVFAHTYFFQLPIQHKLTRFPNHVLAEYLSRTSEPVNVYSQMSSTLHKEYIFYNDLLTKENANEFPPKFTSHEHATNNVQFLPCISEKTQPDKNITIIHEDCGSKIDEEHKPIFIPRLSDSGASYSVYNDTLCSGGQLNGFISDIKTDHLKLDNLSNDVFCSKLLIRE